MQRVSLSELADVPPELQAASYFDFERHPFAHAAVLTEAASVVDAVAAIKPYTERVLAQRQATARESAVCGGRVFGSESGNKLILEEGAVCLGDVWLEDGPVWIGAGTVVEPGAVLKGPVILGQNCEVRSGAYLRGPCIVGDDCTLRGELKNVVLMDRSTFPHPSYLGDSICGHLSHFGNQATAANFGIFNGMLPRSEQANVQLVLDDTKIDLGTRKLGVILGDYCQVGCNSVTDPGTFLRPRTIVYALSRVSAGLYGPDEILKNKPLERGVIERAQLT